jgi:hypothetical protein
MLDIKIHSKFLYSLAVVFSIICIVSSLCEGVKRLVSIYIYIAFVPSLHSRTPNF